MSVNVFPRFTCSSMEYLFHGYSMEYLPWIYLSLDFPDFILWCREIEVMNILVAHMQLLLNTALIKSHAMLETSYQQRFWNRQCLPMNRRHTSLPIGLDVMILCGEHVLSSSRLVQQKLRQQLVWHRGLLGMQAWALFIQRNNSLCVIAALVALRSGCICFDAPDTPKPKTLVQFGAIYTNVIRMVQ